MATSKKKTKETVEKIQIDIREYPNRIFILVDKSKPKNSKLLSTEEVLQAHLNYDGSKYEIIAIPDAYITGAKSDAYKCLLYLGFFKE